MKTNKITMALVAAIIISIFSFGAVVYADSQSVNKPNYDTEVHELLEKAIESGDYHAWLQIRNENNLPTRGKIFSVLSEDNFDKYTELHKASLSGDTDAVNSIRSELGLGQGKIKKGVNKQSSHTLKSSNNAGYFVDSDNDGTCDNSNFQIKKGR